MAVRPIDANPLVQVMLTHSNLSITIPEVYFSMMEPICEIKLSLVKRFGTDVDSMRLILKNEDDVQVVEMADDLKPFGYYNPQNGYIIHVIFYLNF